MPTKPISRYLGIDPGKSGGLALIAGSTVIEWLEMPPTDLDLFLYLQEISSMVSYAVLERVSSMPGEGHAGAFTFGEGYGKLQMALTAAKISYDKITPRVWQKGVGVTARAKQESKPQFKERLRSHAQQLFPSLELWSQPKSLGKQRAVCDALLIAEYCKRMKEGLV